MVYAWKLSIPAYNFSKEFFYNECTEDYKEKIYEAPG